jgi:hypothetical protein
MVGVDYRAEEKQRDFNLPVVSRYLAADALEQSIRGPLVCDIQIPTEGIRRWKEQFCGSGFGSA